MMADCYGTSGCRTRELAFSSLVDTLARRRKVDRSHQSDNGYCSSALTPRRGLGCGNEDDVPVKGLLNPAGENSCFLNSTIQVLWHVDVFRNNFRLLSAHACTDKSCIFCAIKVLFTQFQYSDHDAVPSDCLRKALAETFAVTGRFQLRLMDDAAECFEKILMGLHWHLAHDERVENCTAGHCITHRKFTIYVVEQNVCCCGWTSVPHQFDQTVLYVSTSALTLQHQSERSVDAVTRQESISVRRSFGSCLRSAFNNTSRQRCRQVGCPGPLLRRRTLVNCPDVINIGLVWDSERADVRHIRSVVETIEMEIDTSDMFNLDAVSSVPRKLHLTAIVCYYRRHYCTLIHHVDGDVWTSLDDANIKQIGSGWSAVVEKICSGKYQPLLLVYVTRQHCSQSITLHSAPSQTFFIGNLRHFQKTLGLAVRHKPTDYDGGGSTLESPSHAPVSHGRRAASVTVDQSQIPPFSVDVDACLRSLHPGPSPRRSSSRNVAVSSTVPLEVPDWLTSTDDLTALTVGTRYINPSKVESILRRRGIERLEPVASCTAAAAAAAAGDATRASHDAEDSRRRISSKTHRNTASGCVDQGVVVGCVNYCSEWTPGCRDRTERVVMPDGRRPSVDDDDRHQTSVSCVSEITTRVSEIAVAGSDFYRGRCLPFDIAKNTGCWPRRLPPNLSNERIRMDPCCSPTSVAPPPSAANIPPTEVTVADLPRVGDSPRKTTTRKRVSFADQLTTVVTYSHEVAISCEAEISDVTTSLIRGATMRCQVYDVDDESPCSESVAVVLSMSEDDVDSLDVDAEDDEGFVDEHGASAVLQHADLVRCGLCQRRWVFPPVNYCVDCETYFARLASS